MGQDDELLFGVTVKHRGHLCMLPLRGAPNVLNNCGLVSLKALQKLDRMHQPRVVQRVGRTPARVRRQGVSYPQVKMFKYVNRRAGRARYSTHVFVLKTWAPDISRTCGCQASINVMNGLRRYSHVVKMRCNNQSLTSSKGDLMMSVACRG